MNQTIRKGGLFLLSFFSFFTKETIDPKARKIELVLLFVIGILLGIFLKTLLGPSLTIGYDDYRIAEKKVNTDLNLIQKNALLNKNTFNTQSFPLAGSCSQ